MFAFLITALFVCAGLAIPRLGEDCSGRNFLCGMVECLFGLLLPLFVFLVSAFLVPEWKGGCPHGWVDCFHMGKLALTPIVLWAEAAFYAVVVLRRSKVHSRWIILGLLFGACVATVCLVFGFVSSRAPNQSGLWLFIPAYVALWYGVLGIKLFRESEVNFLDLVTVGVGSSPFWYGSIAWSKLTFNGLPNNPPSCFVVTAAACGHTKIVGPFFAIERRERVMWANRQLIAFWEVESIWQRLYPRSHKFCRKVYNQLGPVIAGSINSRWTADLMYMTLKPAEWASRLVIFFFNSI